MLLLDKGYFDYDYEKVEKPITVSSTKKSKEWIADRLRKFGLPVPDEPKSEEELQEYIIKEESYGS